MHDTSPIRRLERDVPRRVRLLEADRPAAALDVVQLGIGITSSLTVRGKRSGRDRSVLVGLIRVNGAWYIGHPNGEASWTANLREAGAARLAPRPEAPVEVTAIALPNGQERDEVILATSEQQPFPGNLLYGAARRHILSEGRYFRVEAR